MKRLLLLAVLALGCGDDDVTPVDGGADASGDAGVPVRVTLADLVREMHSLDHLARLADASYVTLQSSSWDRRSTTPDDPTTNGWFANTDKGEYDDMIRVDGRREYVMLEAEGPGAVMRIWSANPIGTLRIYVDDFDTPAIEAPMDSTLSGGHADFPEPFAYIAAEGYNLYFPIPYTRRVRVTTDTLHDEPDGLYYHVNYRAYASNVETDAYSSEARAAAEGAVATAMSALSENEAPAPTDMGLLPLRIDRPMGGVVRSLVLRTDGTAETLRQSVLVMRFDGEETVRAPLGDFFGTGPGANALDTVSFDVDPDGTLRITMPMPFETSAEIDVESEAELELMAEAAVEPWTWDERSLHFHAMWGSTGVVDSQPKRDVDFVRIEGSGSYVGTHMMVVNPINEWWGEGDEKIYVDGESFPSWFGTGTEDYFGYAYTDLALFSRPYHAQTRSGITTQVGHISNFRVHVIDPIPFARSLDFDMELWAWVPSPIALHWVCYWYGRNTTDDAAPLRAGDAPLLDPFRLEAP